MSPGEIVLWKYSPGGSNVRTFCSILPPKWNNYFELAWVSQASFEAIHTKPGFTAASLIGHLSLTLLWQPVSTGCPLIPVGIQDNWGWLKDKIGTTLWRILYIFMLIKQLPTLFAGLTLIVNKICCKYFWELPSDSLVISDLSPLGDTIFIKLCRACWHSTGLPQGPLVSAPYVGHLAQLPPPLWGYHPFKKLCWATSPVQQTPGVQGLFRGVLFPHCPWEVRRTPSILQREANSEGHCKSNAGLVNWKNKTLDLLLQEWN